MQSLLADNAVPAWALLPIPGGMRSAPRRLHHLTDGVDDQLRLADLNVMAAFLGNHAFPVGRQRHQLGLQLILHCLHLLHNLGGNAAPCADRGLARREHQGDAAQRPDVIGACRGEGVGGLGSLLAVSNHLVSEQTTPT